jgi:hypothetical protein
MNIGWNRIFEADQQVLSLPSWSAPRLLIVSESAIQRWQDSKAYYPAFRFRAKLFKLVLRFLVTFFPQMFCRQKKVGGASVTSLAVAKWLDQSFKSFACSATAQSLFSGYFQKKNPDVLIEAWDVNPSLRGELLSFARQSFSGMDRCVVLTGSTPHRKKKIIAQVRSRRGTIIGYLKYGQTPEAQACIEQEYSCLTALPAGAGPACIGITRADAFTCMALSPVSGNMLPAKIPVDWNPLFFYLRCLESSSCFSANEHPAILRLQERIQENSTEGKTMGECLSSWIPRLNGVESWSVVFQHGDFAPWNIFKPSGNAAPGSCGLCAIDWEEGVSAGFPLLDVAYFCVQTGYLMEHWSAESAVEKTVQVLTEFGDCHQDIAEIIVRLSAMDAWLRNEDMISGSSLQNFRKDIWRMPIQHGGEI